MLCQCSFGASANEKAEAGRINHAVEQIRAAPNAQKSDLLLVLKRLACEVPELCELQRVCVEGYGEHVAALDDTARGRRLLSDGSSDLEAARALDQARDELVQAAPKIARCADAQGRVQRKYKL